MDENFQAAFRMMTSKQARDAFDLSKEPPSVRERYGMNRFGQCCLLARRLVEGGVRFITVNTFLTVFDEITWDIHGTKPFTSIEGMKNIVAPMYDRAYTRTARRSRRRGMLDCRSSVTWLSSVARLASTRQAGAIIGRSASLVISLVVACRVVAPLVAATRSRPCPPTVPSSRQI